MAGGMRYEVLQPSLAANRGLLCGAGSGESPVPEGSFEAGGGRKSGFGCLAVVQYEVPSTCSSFNQIPSGAISSASRTEALEPVALDLPGW